MNRLHLHHGRFVLIVAILGIVGFGGHVTLAASAQAPPVTSPSLIEVAAVPQAPGAVSVNGQGFTPDGEVYIALYDRWGGEVYAPRWVVATASVYGPDGSQDPALGFIRGGAIEAVFGMASTVYGPNGSQDPALGFHRVDAERIVESHAEGVYGPDGSQDPARGYVPGGASETIAGGLCGAAMMVRAYDASTDTWSNVLDIDLGC